MYRIVAQFGLCLCLTAFSSGGYAASFYVSPDGDDGSSGASLSDAWRTIGAANASLEPGDTVYIRGGKYAGDPIDPARSGTEGAYITYEAYQNEKPVLSNASTAILLNDRSYIRIRGIEVNGGAAWNSASVSTWVSINGGSHNIIEDGNFRYAKGWFGVRLAEGAHRNVLRRNEFDFVGVWSAGSGTETDRGDMVGIVSGANRNLVEDNHFTHAGHNLLVVEGSYNVVRNNVFDNDWSDIEGGEKGNRNLALAGGRYNLFEHNIVRNAGRASDNDAPPAMKAEGRNQIVRRNLIVGNVHTAISTSARATQPHASGNRIYHNTLYDNGGPAWRVSVFDSSLVADDNVFMNNLVLDHRRNPVSGKEDVDTLWQLGLSKKGLGTNRVVNNIIACNGCDEVHELSGIDGRISNKDAESRYPDNFVSTLRRSPTFVSLVADDLANFALAQDSAGMDEGAFLTRTTEAGSGSVVEVEDAGFFFSGESIVAGDVIVVGDDRDLRVLDVDYDADTLHISEDISWGAGEGVSLWYMGAAPDIGAVEAEFAETKRPAPPTWR